MEITSGKTCPSGEHALRKSGAGYCLETDATQEGESVYNYSSDFTSVVLESALE
jgi:hypothetical protein